MRITFAGLILLVCGAHPIRVVAQPTPPRESTASPAELNAWITALGAREFDTRDRAMQSLIAAGQSAIDPALQVTSRGDHEVATRAVMILKGIGEKGDITTLEAVLAALARVAESSTLPVGRRAAEVRERLESVHQERTIDFFRSLGAQVTPELADKWTFVHLSAEFFSIELGPNWKGTEKDLERLKWLRDVEQVYLVGPQVSDGWVRHLREMPRLKSVKIKHANVTAKAVEELSHLERLRALRLMFVPLGDDMIPHLEKCEGLSRLMIAGRTLTPDGEKRLKDKFNDLVECPRGAMLGVTAGQEEPWSVREVVPGTAAEKAGLRPKDRIVKYDGQPVGTFLDLKALISNRDPGDAAIVDVERGVETLQIKIVFGELD